MQKNTSSHYLRPKHHGLYMQIAKLAATRSDATILKVGAALVLPNGFISIGWNGTPSDRDNDCEEWVEGTLRTKKEVIHAEINALKKCLKSGMSVEGGVMFVTHSPCDRCAVHLVDIGLSAIYYLDFHGEWEGLEMLKSCGVSVIESVLHE